MNSPSLGNTLAWNLAARDLVNFGLETATGALILDY
jgi:hypothetical protein